MSRITFRHTQTLRVKTKNQNCFHKPGSYLLARVLLVTMGQLKCSVLLEAVPMPLPSDPSLLWHAGKGPQCHEVALHWGAISKLRAAPWFMSGEHPHHHPPITHQALLSCSNFLS